MTVHEIRPRLALVDATATPAPRSWDLIDPTRPTPMNKYRTLHYRARADYDRAYRSAFMLYAIRAKIPPLPAVIITVGQTCRTGTTLPDVGAAFPTAKAAIDGLVDAGVLPDDSPKFVRYLGFAAPEHGPRDLFLLAVEEYLDPTEGAAAP